ncbi:MAG: Gp49 family protein [Delftia lacustris]|jgi:hypothetical protein|uniref:Gp49 family protein n=2 Tax=Pseudomonadota TaxID=1224 RepID=UPI001D11BC61|nr:MULTISPECIES: Gp49 family protein [Delftia]WON87419.1 Gp49 family protein [Delftia sp. UGAL515B_04]
MNTSPIKPTIGRRVWFRPSAQFLERNPTVTQLGSGQPMDAGIVYVHHDHMVNLAVCDHVGRTHMVPSVPLLAGQWEPSDDDYMVCEWMPYQKGQVAKAEAAPGAIESKAYGDGTTATGPGPLPDLSPTEQSIEAEIQAKGLTAPRVTPADLQANIVHTEIVKHISPSGQVLRWAVLTTRNGFAVTGRPSASVSSSNDNEEIGKKVAIDNAMQELWPLMGYELRSKLAGINDPSKAEQVLGEVLSVVQHYLPPDGGTVHEAMDKIIGLVDPWPLGAASAAAALLSSAGVDSGHTDSTAPPSAHRRPLKWRRKNTPAPSKT